MSRVMSADTPNPNNVIPQTLTPVHIQVVTPSPLMVKQNSSRLPHDVPFGADCMGKHRR